MFLVEPKHVGRVVFALNLDQPIVVVATVGRMVPVCDVMKINCQLNECRLYRVVKTAQSARLTTLLETLPNSMPSIAPKPRRPITIRSAFCLTA